MIISYRLEVIVLIATALSFVVHSCKGW